MKQGAAAGNLPQLRRPERIVLGHPRKLKTSRQRVAQSEGCRLRL